MYDIFLTVIRQFQQFIKTLPFWQVLLKFIAFILDMCGCPTDKKKSIVYMNNVEHTWYGAGVQYYTLGVDTDYYNLKKLSTEFDELLCRAEHPILKWFSIVLLSNFVFYQTRIWIWCHVAFCLWIEREEIENIRFWKTGQLNRFRFYYQISFLLISIFYK